MAEIKPDEELVTELVKAERELAELITDPKFFQAFKLKQELDAKLAAGWKALEGMMLLSKTKKIEGDFGYITLIETTRFEIDEALLPAKFFKKVPDTKKIGDTYKLTNKLPAGTSPKITTSLRKKIN